MITRLRCLVLPLSDFAFCILHFAFRAQPAKPQLTKLPSHPPIQTLSIRTHSVKNPNAGESSAAVTATSPMVCPLQV